MTNSNDTDDEETDILREVRQGRKAVYKLAYRYDDADQVTGQGQDKDERGYGPIAGGLVAALLPWHSVSSCNPPDRETDVEDEQHRYKPHGSKTDELGVSLPGQRRGDAAHGCRHRVRADDCDRVKHEEDYKQRDAQAAGDSRPP